MIQLKRVIPLTISLLVTLTLPSVSHSDEGKINIDVLEKTTTSWDGTPLPVYPQGQPEITILRITVAPGTQLAVHEHPYINAGVLLRGQLTVVTEKGETLHLQAGQAIVEVIDKWHYGKNNGTEPAEIIVFYAGIKDKPITIVQDNTNHTESSTQPEAGKSQ